jgi:uncharacterized membrane protein YcgQ (UPF0703/DUF1980 family)
MEKTSVLSLITRPNFLVNELQMYVSYLEKINDNVTELAIAKTKNGIYLKLNRWNSVLQTVNEYIIAFEDQKKSPNAVRKT